MAPRVTISYAVCVKIWVAAADRRRTVEYGAVCEVIG
jgi:hypothetical protein